MMTNCCGNTDFMQNNENAQGGFFFLLFGFLERGVEAGWGDFFCPLLPVGSHRVPKMFMSCSQHVPQVLNMFPIAAHLLSHIVWPLFMYKTWVGAWAKWKPDKECFYSREGSIFRLLPWEKCLLFQKYWWWDNQMTHCSWTPWPPSELSSGQRRGGGS